MARSRLWMVGCLAAVGASVACGSTDSSTSGAGGQTTSSPASSSMSASEAASTGSTGGGGGAGGGCSGATPAALTVKNYDAWCDVTIGMGAPSASSEQTICVADGMVALDATAHTGFTFNAWHGTAGDMGMGEAKAMTSVNVTGNSACVWVCCNTTGAMDCPTTNQCP